MQYREREDFEAIFLKFLRKLCVLLLTRFLERPTVSAVKSDVLKLDAQIINTAHPLCSAGFEEKKLEDEYAIQEEQSRTDGLIIRPHTKMVRMMLKLLAYNIDSQSDLLPEKWEIEHIFPQTWDTKYYTFSEEDANDMLEHLGNKLPLEKALNISASNNYFSKKKDAYRASKIAICQILGGSSLNDWNLDNIDKNDAKVCSIIKGLFKKWVNEYEPIASETVETLMPTEEELAMIEHLKSKGFI